MADYPIILLQMYNFCVTLMVKTGNAQWLRMLQKLKLHTDLDFAGTAKDPIKYLLLKNVVSSPALMPNREPWHSARKKSDIFFQLLINACSTFGDTVVDLTASTGASL